MEAIGAIGALRAKLVIGVVAALLAVLAMAVTAGAGSAGAATKREPVEVRIIGIGRLLDGGATLRVRAKIRCHPVGEVLEALATASQDDNAIAGEGFFSTITCDGRPHILSARIQPFDEQPFHRGRAHVSAFVLLSDGSSDFSGQDTRTVPVR